MRNIEKFTFAILVALPAMFQQISLCQAQSASDQFPNQPIDLVLPFAAGGQTDIIARVVAQALSEELGTSVIVQNRPGAGGAIGVSSVAHAAADGYTLLATDISFVVVPSILPQTHYDPAKDFRMIGQTSRSALTLAIAPGTSAANLKQFIDEARKPDSNISIAHAGIGSTPHLAALSFAAAAGINPLMVAYGGMTPATNDLIGNRVTAAFMGPAGATSLAKQNMLKMLAVTGDRRVGSNPDVPTFAELGMVLPGFEQGTWYGLAAPAGTPDAVIAKLSSALKRALSKRSVADQLLPSDVYPNYTSAAEFDAFIHDQIGKWKAVLASAGVKPGR